MIRVVNVLLFSRYTAAQIGTTICVCSPAVYEMQLNFTGNTSALIGDGISTSDFDIAPFQNLNVTDLVAVSAGSIDILELDADLVLLSQSSRFGTFNDGDIIRFASVSNDPSMINETFYPKGLQISIVGNNALGETLFFAGLIVYNTECNQYPLIEEGSRLGWITFTKFEDPSRQICPLADTRPPSTTTAPIPIATPPVTPPTPILPPLVPVIPSTPIAPIAPLAPTATIPTNSPQRSTKSPSPIRSTKSPSPVSRETKLPVKNPIGTNPPVCVDGKGKKSGKKDKDKSDKGKGKGKEKGKGKGKGKSKGMGKGKGNIFDHDECTPSPTTVSFGKGKGKGGKGSNGSDDDDVDDDHSGVTVPPHPAPASVPIAVHAPTTSSPSMEDSRSGDSIDSSDGSSDNSGDPQITSNGNNGNDEEGDDDDDDDSTSNGANRIYSNSYPLDSTTSNAGVGGNGLTSTTTNIRSNVGQKMGYSMLFLLACGVGIVSGLIIYRQQHQHQTSSSKQQQQQRSNDFSWIKWGMILPEKQNVDTLHTAMVTTNTTTPTKRQRRRRNRRTMTIPEVRSSSSVSSSSSSSSSASSTTEQDKLTSKFRNVI